MYKKSDKKRFQDKFDDAKARESNLSWRISLLQDEADSFNDAIFKNNTLKVTTNVESLKKVLIYENELYEKQVRVIERELSRLRPLESFQGQRRRKYQRRLDECFNLIDD